jgi:hypothetical protein
VITGFNTDIEYEGITYHVQTEDKGLATPIILSLVYNRGTILASKRSPYDDLLSNEADEVDEGVLAERLQKQHKLMCAAIRAGRLEDLKRMTEANRKASGKATGKKAKKDEEPEESPKETELGNGKIDAIDEAAVSTEELPEYEMPIPMPTGGPSLIGEMAQPVQFFKNFDPFADEPILPVEAIKTISDLAGASRPEHNNLNVEIIGDVRFTSGDKKTVCIMVSRGSEHKVIKGVDILAKVIGSDFKPRIFHATTDQNGLANVKVKLPSFASGRAALIIRARDEAEEVELRREVAHG